MVTEQRHIEMLRMRFEHSALADERHRALLLAEHSNRAKGRFLAAVSHEMRTPLNGIMGMSEIVRETASDALTQQRAGVILKSAEHLKRVIGDLLDLSRIEQGRPDLLPAPMDPRQALLEVTELLAPVAADKGLLLNTQVDNTVPAQVQGDAARIRQVLHNLVGNAIKFTRTGRVDVALRATSDGLAFEVRDTGIGIAADRHQAVFDAFEPSPSTRASDALRTESACGNPALARSAGNFRCR